MAFKKKAEPTVGLEVKEAPGVKFPSVVCVLERALEKNKMSQFDISHSEWDDVQDFIAKYR